MMAARDYRDLVAWQKAMDMVEDAYRSSRGFPSDERYGLTAQLRRAAASVPANIAEGQGRRTVGEFRQALSVANGSLREFETHVMLAARLSILPTNDSERLLLRAAEVGRLVSGLARGISVHRGQV